MDHVPGRITIAAIGTIKALAEKTQDSKFFLEQWLVWARCLSLDVALGALGGGCMAAAYLGATMHWSWYLVLPLAVWVTYTADHLIDAYRLGQKASTPRHQFHVKHLRILTVLAVLVGSGCLALAFLYLGKMAVLFGFATATLVALHFSMVMLVGTRISPWLFKEVGVASVYAIGIWGLPVIVSGAAWEPNGIIAVLQFMLLALVNLLEFSLFELEIDARDGQTSFVRAIGKRRSIQLVRILLGIVAALGVALLMISDDIAVIRLEMVFGLMAAILGTLLYRKAWFSQHERYRAWGDAAFLLPFFYLILAWQ